MQTGKSFTLGTVLPSVIAQHERFGVGKPSEPLVLFLNGRSLARAVKPLPSLFVLHLPLLKCRVHPHHPSHLIPHEINNFRQCG